MDQKLISEGAEAKIFLSKNTVHKQRIEKSYRHAVLDKQIRKRRTKSEAKILTKAFEYGCNVPRVISQDVFDIELEFIVGDRLSQTLSTYPEELQSKIMERVGVQTALLHDNNIIHGDLTTSNVIFSDKKVFVIDFGLGFISRKIEDKAVDIHLIKQALNAKHYENHEALFEKFLEGYNPVDKNKILQRLTAVEKRGRYRH